MGDKWTLEVITPQKNMALFTKKMLNIFKKYDKPFENSVLVNVETMAYDTPNGPKPWRGEITYPVLDADAGSGQSDMSIASPQSGAMDAAACTGQADMSIAAPQTGAMDMKTPTAVNINEQTYVGTNEPDEQDDPEEQEDHATSTSPKTDAHELTVLPASAKNNETIILSSDKCPRNFKLIISPMTDKRVSVALRSMSYLEIDQTYSVNLDCLIEDAFLSKSYELKVTQHDPYKFLQKTKKSCWKDVSCDYRHEKLNKMESLRNNRTFMVMDSPNGIPKGHLCDQSEIHSQTSGCCDSRELLDKPNVEEIAISSFQGAHEELNTSSKATYSLGDVYSGLVKRIARSMLGPISKSSFRTRRNSYKSKYAKSIIIKRKATDSTILKSSVKTASECGTLATTHNKTRVQSLECSTLATTHNKTRAQSLECSTLATLHNKTSTQNLECSTLATTHNKTSALRLECSTLATTHNKTSAQSLECSTLTTTHNKTSAQSLEYSPVSLCKKYFLPTSTLVAKPDEIACSDSFHEKSVVTLGEGSRTSLVSDGSSSTTRAILMPEGLLKNRREMTNPPPLETDHQYEADVCGPHAVSRKTVDDRPQYTNLRCPTIQESACEHSLAAAVTFNADNQAHEVCCSESAGCLCCKHSQHLMQSATHTFVNIPVVSQKTNLPGKENNIQAGLQMAKHTTCKQYCSPSPDGEIQRKKFDISQMSSVYLNIKQNSSLKDEKEESNFDKIYRKLCLESNSPLPVLKKASSSTKTLVSSEKPNELINSPPFYKKVKRNSDFHGDDPIVPNGKKVKSRNVNFNSSEIVNYLYGGVNSPNIEKSPAYLHSNAKWL